MINILQKDNDQLRVRCGKVPQVHDQQERGEGGTRLY